jgi:hypothetical protein
VTGWPALRIPGFPVFLTLFVLGLWAERVGLASNLSDYISLIRRALWVALVCAVVGFFIGQNLE